MRTSDAQRLRTRLLIAIGALSAVSLHQGARAGAQEEPKTECLAPEASGQCPSDEEALNQLRDKDPAGCLPILDKPGATLIDMKCCYQVRYDCSAQVVGCTCFTGHPLLVEGRPLEGGTRALQGWQDARLPKPEISGLSDEQRQLLALHWARIGAAEYVSIAGFQRFVMDLMLNGAPPSLIKRAQRAAQDELRHARLAFTLASAFAGVPIGPAALDLPAALPLHRSLRELVVACAEEGCVVETLSACLLAEALERATDPAIVAVLKQIRRDEDEHAALAWETLRWALAQDRSHLEAAKEALRSTMAKAGILGFAHPAGLEAFGLLRPSQAEASQRAAIQRVIEPCWEALLAQVNQKAPPSLKA